MKSRTSFFSTGILLNDLKRFAWTSAGYLLILLFSIPLQVFMRYSSMEETQINDVFLFSRIFQFDPNQSFLHVVSLILVPVLAGMLLFRYIQDNRAADMIHALPVSRDALYCTHAAAGIILLYTPLLLTALVSWALAAALGIEISADILVWLLISLLFNLLFFLCSAAVGMVTGMTTLQGVLSYILLLLPSGLLLLLVDNFGRHIYGFAQDYYFDKINALSPLIRLTEIPRHPMQPVEITVYLLISIALFFAGGWLYRRRHAEMAGGAMAFDVLRPVFKYSVTFCGMLLLGSYFNAGLGSPGWTYFGYFLGSLLFYFLAEILLNKSLQVFQRRHLRNYGIYALAVIVLYGAVHFDLTGYEKRLPDLNEVKSVYMDHSFYVYNYMPDPNVQAGGYNLPPAKAIYTEKENLDAIYALHREIVRRLPDAEKLSGAKQAQKEYERICLAYEMQNGSRIYRQYQVYQEDYAEYLKPVYESREYKEYHNEILRINPADVESIDINVYDADKRVRIIEPGLINQAIGALRRDIEDETYEEMINMRYRAPWAEIFFYMRDNHNTNIHYGIGLSWKKSYINFEKWLIETGKYDQARLLPGEDVACAYVDNNPGSYTREPDKQELEKNPGILKTDDRERLELCLRNYHTNSRQAAYNVFFVLNNGRIVPGYFTGKDAPVFVKEHFTP